ncbi:hypothetical protein CLTEP_26270 [Clostridium tepidiprofundi DSM 19306]|uniref:Uncharacterized protein n=1 Tax=Clostridium tepidiprofundi DSM 19306 TaxID=1121338 RepID=A0A151ASC4_9CLOT|nr:hypothetical protein [Clostridium tepidiprofundi]KYH30480.1 hypothetical protein CLTEP_26270 [Clostridium tepidiprofundi DSM 19306]
MFKEVDRKKSLLDSKRTLSQHTLKSIRENLVLEGIYNSNVIEGNTLHLVKTKVVIE